MSDEESFVILGSTPTPSMEAYSSLAEDSRRTPPGSLQHKSLATEFEKSTTDASWAIERSIKEAIGKELGNDNSIEPPIKTGSKKISNQSAKTSLASRSIGEISLPESIAEKYLLGKVGETEVRTYISNMFPSFTSTISEQNDIKKLHQLVIDHEAFKNEIVTMSSKLEDLMKMVTLKDLKHEGEIKKLREENLGLKEELTGLIEKSNESAQLKDEEREQELKKIRKDNLDLKHEIEALKVNNDLLQKDQFELVQKISEGKSVMNNISAHMERMEMQQHDISLLNQNESLVRVTAPETPLTYEAHQNIKQLQGELSLIKAENLDLQDMKKIYIDEINCLKVNLTAAEELLQQAQADISLLKSKDIEKSKIIARCEAETKELKQDLGVFKQQWEVYRTDFEIERNAREQLAGEKDQLLTDLKLLQRRVQQLLEENERLSSAPPPVASSSASLHQPTAPHLLPMNNFVCPICSKAFSSLGPLELHVQSCY